jgi:hypothetical protein
MPRTITETKLADEVTVRFRRGRPAATLDWSGRIEVSTVLDTGEVHRRVERTDLMERLTAAQQTQIKAALDAIVQRIAAFLEVSPS